MSVIEIKHLTKKFKKKKLYEEVNLNIENSNQMISIWGKSGSGKSTLLNMLLGYDKEYSGTITVLDKDMKKLSKSERIKYLREEVANVYQDYKLYSKLTVYENLNFVAQEEELIKYLKLFKIENLKDKKISTLSGGEKQKVAIIRALVKKPKLLILDEPTATLDEKSFFDLLKILQQLKLNTTILIVTHDERIIDYSDSIYSIKNNEIVCTKKFNGQIEDKKILSNSFKSLSGLKVTRKLIKEKRNSYIVKIVLMSLIISIFLVLLTSSNYVIKNMFDTYYGGMSDNVVVLDLGAPIEPYIEYGIEFSSPPDKLAWSEEDKEKVEAIEGVDKVYFMSSNKTKFTDGEDNALDMNIDSNHYPESIKTKPSHLSGKKIEVKFKSLPEPKEVIPYYKVGPLFSIDLLAGDYPSYGTEEILIPDFIAEQILIDKEYENYDKLIGQYLDLNVVNILDEKKISKSYQISGVYNTDYENYLASSYRIYLPWVPCLISREDLVEQYNSNFKDINTSNSIEEEKTMKYYTDVYKDVESFVKATGVNEGQMAVILEDGYTSEDVYDDIKALYPNIFQKSNYSYNLTDPFKDFRKRFFLGTISMEIIFIIISSLILLVVQRGYSKNRLKDYFILFSMGYTKKQLLGALMIETIIDSVFVFLLIVIIAKIIGLIPFSIFYYYSHGIFIPLNIFCIITMIIFSNIPNIILTISKIKYKNISKILK